jgi:2-dehydro-3-deoxyphosphooctonate aldolase (KDO 8-P synthase)
MPKTPLLASVWEREASSTPRPFFLIAGPCVIESEAHCLKMAGEIKRVAEEAGVELIFKASFDKANRTSIASFRGPGIERGLEVLDRVKARLGIPVTSDIHLPEQAWLAAEVLDVIQIPAFLCRQTDLLTAAAETGRIVNVKKGQFLAPWDVRHVVEKIRETGNPRVLITERGTSFGYNNLVVDFKGFAVMGQLGCGLVFDGSHSVQLPGGAGDRSGGQAEIIPSLAAAAVAVGVDGLFLEVHDCPERALSDGPNALPLDRLRSTLHRLKRIEAASRGRANVEH